MPLSPVDAGLLVTQTQQGVADTINSNDPVAKINSLAQTAAGLTALLKSPIQAAAANAAAGLVTIEKIRLDIKYGKSPDTADFLSLAGNALAISAAYYMYFTPTGRAANWVAIAAYGIGLAQIISPIVSDAAMPAIDSNVLVLPQVRSAGLSGTENLLKYTLRSLVTDNVTNPKIIVNKQNVDGSVRETNLIYTVKNGDTVSAIAKKYGVSEDSIYLKNLEINRTTGLIQPNQNLVINLANHGVGSTWTVGAGATGELIAAANGITLAQLQAANPGVNVANPPIGTVLNLPTVQNGLLVSTTTQAPNFNATTTAPTSQTPFNVDNNTLIYNAVGKVLGLGNVNTASGSYAFINDMISDYFKPGNSNLSTNDYLFGFGNIDFIGNNAGGVSLGANGINNASTGLSTFTPTDPLVLDLNGDGVRLTNYRDAPVLFDIDHDSGGTKEQTGWVSAQDGMVVYDRNNNGKIDDISETLSEYFGGAIGTNGSAGAKPYANGLAALKSLDSNNDNQFTAADAQWANVKVWVDANHDGVTDAGELKTLASLNITSINLTQTAQSGLVRDGNEILASSTFVQNGQTKEALAANFIANPNGSTFTASGTGTLTTTEGNVKSYTAGNGGETVDVAQKGVNNAQGGSGNDTLIGDSTNNWLAGSLGTDTINAGAGDDVILFDSQDTIDGGDGNDVAQVIGDAGVTLNLANAHIEAVVGGRGDDTLIGVAANDLEWRVAA